jgi:hypothetical protein
MLIRGKGVDLQQLERSCDSRVHAMLGLALHKQQQQQQHVRTLLPTADT